MLIVADADSLTHAMAYNRQGDSAPARRAPASLNTMGEPLFSKAVNTDNSILACIHVADAGEPDGRGDWLYSTHDHVAIVCVRESRRRALCCCWIDAPKQHADAVGRGGWLYVRVSDYIDRQARLHQPHTQHCAAIEWTLVNSALTQWSVINVRTRLYR